MAGNDQKKKRVHPMLDAEHPFTRFLTKLANLMILNILTLALVIPVFTAGAALTALFGVLQDLAKGEESGIVRRYFHIFKQSFGDATMLYLIYLLLFTLQLTAFVAFLGGSFQPSAPMIVLAAGADIVFFGSAVYGFSLTARYHNTVGGTFKNSMKLLFGFLPMSLSVVAAFALSGFVLVKTWPYLGAFGVLFGLSLPGYLSEKEILKIFARVNGEEDPEEE